MAALRDRCSTSCHCAVMSLPEGCQCTEAALLMLPARQRSVPHTHQHPLSRPRFLLGTSSHASLVPSHEVNITAASSSTIAQDVDSSGLWRSKFILRSGQFDTHDAERKCGDVMRRCAPWTASPCAGPNASRASNTWKDHPCARDTCGAWRSATVKPTRRYSVLDSGSHFCSFCHCIDPQRFAATKSSFLPH